ncbi:hypothetical protein A6X21_06450 [Planctopirus hydrillae]|uniref:Uncharacterized protein n=1 Tax=Planctopirus hydrillae TaxID=1841610 RepID=A0A1C3E9M7_9PLAN|nr:hypothetical protein A6X21_06450 [Planctopirus hydrillae]
MARDDKHSAMKPLVDCTPQTCKLALIPAFSRRNGRRGKTLAHVRVGEGGRRPGEGLADGNARVTKASAGAPIDCP